MCFKINQNKKSPKSAKSARKKQSQIKKNLLTQSEKTSEISKEKIKKTSITD
ncbi:hypothetical protein BC749_102856 [Flavobacterium araucananum]|nr:hypothetical protein BC749_102856 [Flavobacterium araucananum]